MALFLKYFIAQRIFSLQSQEVQFFGAITLHSKLMKFWHEVPPENRDELKQKLLEHIIMFAGGPKIVLNRLCIAVSWLCFVPHEWIIQNNLFPPAQCIYRAHAQGLANCD